MSLLGSTAGSGDTTSPDPAQHGGFETAYESWCDAHSLDPFDDDNREQFEIELDLRLEAWAGEIREREDFDL